MLGDLVEKYEDEHVEMPHVSDAAMLRSLMDEKGVRQADVVRGTGISKTVLSLVLNGKRDLTREHIAALSKYFGVSVYSFLGPVESDLVPAEAPHVQQAHGAVVRARSFSSSRSLSLAKRPPSHRPASPPPRDCAS